MNILFLTISRLYDLEQKGIYSDLLREFVKKGHNVVVCAPAERFLKEETNLNKHDGYCILRIKTGNLRKTNIIEKGLSTVLLESQFLHAIKKHLNDVKFDLVIYSTPPITFAKVVNFIKKRDGAKTYLLLKDIFPQNAVDMGMFSKNGILYKFFRNKEKQLYKKSDYIGCMSQANVDYIIKHNSYIDSSAVHVSPNSVEIIEQKKNELNKDELRKRYGIPINKTVFIYGGNLGKPQGIPFIIRCLEENKNCEDRFFVICGTGTEFSKLKTYVDENEVSNVLLINGLPKDEYEELVAGCDIGLIFLDHRFTIPNFPSRILSYMNKKMPVLACTDSNTDIGRIITEGNFGWWCASNEEREFKSLIDNIVAMSQDDMKRMGERAYEYLLMNYSSDQTCEKILECIQ